jgi:hypothetical protein
MRRPRAPAAWGTGRAVTRSAARVRGPTRPSRSRRSHFWKATTAWYVAAVKLRPCVPGGR